MKVGACFFHEKTKFKTHSINSISNYQKEQQIQSPRLWISKQDPHSEQNKKCKPKWHFTELIKIVNTQLPITGALITGASWSEPADQTPAPNR